jgi:hypothetical protein
MCVPCDAGRFRTKVGPVCDLCPEGRYSGGGGALCVDCTSPAIVTAQTINGQVYPRSVCALPYNCGAGAACPEGVVCAQDNCVACAPGWASLGTEACLSCNEQGQVAKSDQSVCESCSPGKQPNNERTACEFCAGRSESAFGIVCLDCPTPNHVDPATCAMTNGTACALNANQTGCALDAQDGCIFTIGHTSCTVCPAGAGPNDDYTGCKECIGATYSTSGVCLECDATNNAKIVNLGHTTCTKCDAGKESNANQTACLHCDPGNITLGVLPCAPCSGQGERANDQQSACEACGPGTQPNTQRTLCKFCEGRTYSEFGIACSECTEHDVINQATCTDGNGAACEMNAEQSGCALTARAGCVFTIGRTTCARCAPGQGSRMPNYDGCDPCPLGNYSSDGVCGACGAGEIPNANIAATGCDDKNECAPNSGNGPCDIIAEKLGNCTTTNLGTQVCTSPCRNEPPVRLLTSETMCFLFVCDLAL